MGNNIKGKVVVITGASSGLGEATARLLSARAPALRWGARRHDRVQSLAGELAGRRGKAIAYWSAGGREPPPARPRYPGRPRRRERGWGSSQTPPVLALTGLARQAARERHQQGEAKDRGPGSRPHQDRIGMTEGDESERQPDKTAERPAQQQPRRDCPRAHPAKSSAPLCSCLDARMARFN
jgi:hypothetical protein